MSQEQRDRGSEKGQPGRARFDREQHQKGFEGMNYEQPRPRYQTRPGKEAPQKNSEPAGNDDQDA